MGAYTVLQEIEHGSRRFAWLPTPLHIHGGWIRAGWTWMRPVLRKRRIGFDSYYYTRTTPPHPYQEGESE